MKTFQVPWRPGVDDINRLLKKAHLRRWLRRSSLQRTTKYVSLLTSSPPCIWTFLNSLHWQGVFQHPAKVKCRKRSSMEDCAHPVDHDEVDLMLRKNAKDRQKVRACVWHRGASRSTGESAEVPSAAPPALIEASIGSA